MAPSRHDWKIVDWDVKPQHNQPTKRIQIPDSVDTDQTAPDLDLHCLLRLVCPKTSGHYGSWYVLNFC